MVPGYDVEDAVGKPSAGHGSNTFLDLRVRFRILTGPFNCGDYVIDKAVAELQTLLVVPTSRRDEISLGKF